MKRNTVIFLLIVGFITGWFGSGYTLPEAKAIDPVTIAILAPVALKAAQIASPYVLRGLKNMGVASLKVFPDFLDLFKLPIGMGLLMFGWPFGGLSRGLTYTFKGFCAPFKLAFHIVMIPVGAFGIGIN